MPLDSGESRRRRRSSQALRPWKARSQLKRAILASPDFPKVRAAFAKGTPEQFVIEGRTIVLEPDAPISGMTLFDEQAFVIGREAFISETELTKTVLHELYRLRTSARVEGAGISSEMVSSETVSAFTASEKIYGIAFEKGSPK